MTVPGNQLHSSRVYVFTLTVQTAGKRAVSTTQTVSRQHRLEQWFPNGGMLTPGVLWSNAGGTQNISTNLK